MKSTQKVSVSYKIGDIFYEDSVEVDSMLERDVKKAIIEYHDNASLTMDDIYLYELK